MGLNKNAELRASPIMPRTVPRARASQSNQKAHATVRRVPKPVPVTLLKCPKDFSVPERERDLRTAISSKGMKTKRWAREGELVWCSLDPPIVDDEFSPSPDGIILLPGLVNEIRLKPRITAARHGSAKQDVEMADTPHDNIQEDTVGPTISHDHNGHELSPDDDCPYTVTHSVVYKLKLLAVQSECLVPDDQLLPYQALHHLADF